MEKMEELKPTSRPLNLQDGWEDQVNRRAAKKAVKRQRNCFLWMFCLALVLITIGGIFMRQVAEVPLVVSASVAVGGTALLVFLLGLFVGLNWRR